METRTLFADHALVEVLICQLVINNRRPRNGRSLELMREVLKYTLVANFCLGINPRIKFQLAELLHLASLLVLSVLAEPNRLRLLFIDLLRKRRLVLLV